MAQPTRDQFNAAAQHVLQTAPAGLSREAFFALIDKELSGPVARPSMDTTYDDPALAQKDKLESGEIPSSWIDGFTHSLKDQFLTPTVKNSALEHEAHPETIGDFLGLLVPQGVNRSAQLIKEMEQSGQAAASARTGLLGKVRGFWSGVWDDMNAKPTQEAREEMMLNDGAKPLPSAPPTGPTRDLYDVYKDTGTASYGRKVPPSPPKPAPVPPPEPMSVGGQRIDPKDKLFAKLKELTDQAESAAGGPSAPAPIDPRISGVEAPSAPPSAPATAPKDAMLEALAERFGMGKANPSTETLGAGPMPGESAPLGTPRPISIKPESLTPELWGELRRYYGAEKLAQLTGKTVEEVRQMAPGPSLQPLEVQDRLMQDPEGLFRFLPK